MRQQVGLPSDQNQYVHRLGRTARAGKDGRGLMLLTDAEKGFLREVLSYLRFSQVIDQSRKVRISGERISEMSP